MSESSRPVGPFDAFLCHSSEDKATVRAIAKAIRAAGMEVWLDEEQIAGGDAILGEIERGAGRQRGRDRLPVQALG